MTVRRIRIEEWLWCEWFVRHCVVHMHRISVRGIHLHVILGGREHRIRDFNRLSMRTCEWLWLRMFFCCSMVKRGRSVATETNVWKLLRSCSACKGRFNEKSFVV